MDNMIYKHRDGCYSLCNSWGSSDITLFRSQLKESGITYNWKASHYELTFCDDADEAAFLFRFAELIL